MLKRVLIWGGAAVVVVAAGALLYLRSLGMFASAPVYANAQGAIGGYDPVAYFTQGAAVPGSPQIGYEWNGARWHFASVEHRDRFAADPERYAPQFGGYCALAVGSGYTARSAPDIWEIVDDRLYLNFDADVREQWRADSARLIEQGHRNWPGVLLGR